MFLSNLHYNPKMDWLIKQEKENTKDGDKYWLWDNDVAAMFLFAELYNEGMRAISHAYTYWLSMMMKHADEPYLSFIKEYIETGVRKYTYDLNGITPFEAMRTYGDPYILSVFRIHKENHPELYDPDENNIVWDFDTSVYRKNVPHFKKKDLHYILLNDDKNGYRFMTDEEIEFYLLLKRDRISEDDYNALMDLNEKKRKEVCEKIKIVMDKKTQEWINESIKNNGITKELKISINEILSATTCLNLATELEIEER